MPFEVSNAPATFIALMDAFVHQFLDQFNIALTEDIFVDSKMHLGHELRFVPYCKFFKSVNHMLNIKSVFFVKLNFWDVLILMLVFLLTLLENNRLSAWIKSRPLDLNIA